MPQRRSWFPRNSAPGVYGMRLIDSTVLVVEDEPMLLEVTAGWFEREGGCVRTAEDGSRALEAMTSSRVDLIVTDIHMPELDGLSFLRKVKALGAYTPSIVFISSGSDVSARDGFDLGIEATFSKPVARLQLIAAAERILAGTGPLWGPAWHGAKTGPLLSATFGSLSSALRMGQIAFGKGGFCVESGNRSLKAQCNSRLILPPTPANFRVMGSSGGCLSRSGESESRLCIWRKPVAAGSSLRRHSMRRFHLYLAMPLRRRGSMPRASPMVILMNSVTCWRWLLPMAMPVRSC